MNEELKQLEKKMASKYKMFKTERQLLSHYVAEKRIIWIYLANRTLNPLPWQPTKYKTKFIIRPKIKP